MACIPIHHVPAAQRPRSEHPPARRGSSACRAPLAQAVVVHPLQPQRRLEVRFDARQRRHPAGGRWEGRREGRVEDGWPLWNRPRHVMPCSGAPAPTCRLLHSQAKRGVDQTRASRRQPQALPAERTCRAAPQAPARWRGTPRPTRGCAGPQCQTAECQQCYKGGKVPREQLAWGHSVRQGGPARAWRPPWQRRPRPSARLHPLPPPFPPIAHLSWPPTAQPSLPNRSTRCAR